MSALLQASDGVAESGAESDHRLVAADRRGDDRALDALYQRYQRRIQAYAFGMVKDHQRAEDVTQEVFVSALRRMRATERPIAFKPWIYEIAKNACIDQFRRSKRAEEVSLQADDGLAPSDYGRLVGSDPAPHDAVAAKQELNDLCGAFGGLSETHHEILVLRELEGLSYAEIGRRMGMSRPAVESTLFRARRRLTEEYDDIVSGARCERIQGIIVAAVESRLGARDTRRLARHLSHCQPCRREALAAGVDRELFARPSVRERIAQLGADAADRAVRDPPGPCKLVERLALGQLRDEVGVAAVLAHLVERHDPAVVEPRRGLGLAQHAPPRLAARLYRLHRHPPLQALVPGAVDGPEAARAQALDERETAQNGFANHHQTNFGAWAAPPAAAGVSRA